MPVDTIDHAMLVGYCHGTLSLPDGELCPVCGFDAGLTPGGYVGHHVEEPGPRSIHVDEDESLTTLDAINTPAHGLLLACLPGSADEDEWQVFHAGTGLVIHLPKYTFTKVTALGLACQLDTLGNWLASADAIQGDSQLAMASQMLCFMAHRGLDPEESDENDDPAAERGGPT